MTPMPPPAPTNRPGGAAAPPGAPTAGDVVVGVDGSAGACRALDQAVQLAAGSGAALRVLHAYTRPVWVDAVAGLPTAVAVSATEARALAVAHADGWVARALARCGERRPVTVVTQVVEGSPGDLLVRAARDAALLVIGRRTHGPLAAALLGSASAPVLHHATCPVLVVPPHGPPPAAAGPRRIVVGVDGSPAGRAALRWAASFAGPSGCPVVAVRAWNYDTVPGFPPMLTIPTDEEYAAAALDWLRAELATALPGDPPVEPVARRGRPATVLQDLAGPDDLLVLGTRGHGRLGAGLLLGSVAAHCAQHAAAPVLLVRAAPVTDLPAPAGQVRGQDRREVSTGA